MRAGATAAAETPARARPAPRVAGAALALVAVAIVDDRVVHPEPGTGAGDHVASTLVPLAALALVARALPRVRAGARAALLAVCGVLAIVGGTADGAADAVARGLGGDDVTALLALGAGVVLVGLAGLELWRSRGAGTWPRRIARAVVAALVVVFVVAPVAVSLYATHRLRGAREAPDLGPRAVPVALRTSDGLRLSAWYVPSRTGAAVVVSGSGPHAAAAGRTLARHGYGVLLYDARGYGSSDGDPNAYGWRGERDVRAALDALVHRPGVDPRRIGGVGLSVGGEVLLQTAAHDRRLRAVVSEGAGARSIAEQRHSPGRASWMNWISPMVAQTAATAVFSDTAPPPDLAGLVGQIAPRGMLVVWSRDGQPAEELNTVYYARAGRGRAQWVLDEGGHTGAIEADPAGYVRRVVGFLDRALG
jgi:hypothetical protein